MEEFSIKLTKEEALSKYPDLVMDIIKWIKKTKYQ